MKKILWVFIPFLFSCIENEERIISLAQKPWGPILWENDSSMCDSVKVSEELVAIEFSGKNANYALADTWYPTWASDGNLYSPFTDGTSGIWGLCFSGVKHATTGQAQIIGNDPMSLEVKPLGINEASPEPYGGRYPCGSLIYNDIWYYGTYCLDAVPAGYNWGTMGPFVGFRISKDYGKTWIECPHTPSNPLFGENAKDGNVVKLGAPHFVDFGKNMEHSPDGKAYLVCHGSIKEDPHPRPANNSWISGDQIYLIRVVPTIENINNINAYEFYCGRDELGNPIWSKTFDRIKPIFEWNNHCGCVTITYNHVLKKYLMCITDGWPTIKQMSTYIMESDSLEGEWKLITYMKNFGEQAYFVNIPSKFINPDDGSNMWLCYSGNFVTYKGLGVNPPGGRYGMVLQEINILNKEKLEKYPFSEKQKTRELEIEKWMLNNDLLSDKNKALIANVEVSSCLEGYSKNGINDGVVDGYPERIENEWASNRQTVNSWVRYSWDENINISKIWIFDRLDRFEHIKSVGIKMSDGTIYETGEIPNIEGKGLEVEFSKKKGINWIEFVITGVGYSTNSGFAEIAVF